MFTWIKISGAWQLEMERRKKNQTLILKGFSLHFFVLSLKSWVNLLKIAMLA